VSDDRDSELRDWLRRADPAPSAPAPSATVATITLRDAAQPPRRLSGARTEGRAAHQLVMSLRVKCHHAAVSRTRV